MSLEVGVLYEATAKFLAFESPSGPDVYVRPAARLVVLKVKEPLAPFSETQLFYQIQVAGSTTCYVSDKDIEGKVTTVPI